MVGPCACGLVMIWTISDEYWHSLMKRWCLQGGMQPSWDSIQLHPRPPPPHPAITEDSPTGAIPASSSTLGPAAPGQPKVSELSIMSLYKEA